MTATRQEPIYPGLPWGYPLQTTLGDGYRASAVKPPSVGATRQVDTSAMTAQWLITNSVMPLAATDNPVIAPPEIVAFAPAAGAAPLTL